MSCRRAVGEETWARLRDWTKKQKLQRGWWLKLFRWKAIVLLIKAILLNILIFHTNK
jgi:hypothetical protein